MAVKTTKGISKQSAGNKVNVIIIDAKDEESRKVEAKGIMQLAKLVRESRYTVKRCIMAIHDPEVATFYNIPSTDNRKYAMVELCGTTDKKNNNIDLNLKMFKLFLNTNKYTVVSSKVFKNGDYPTAKVIVKL
jgi:hypothetical protein